MYKPPVATRHNKSMKLLILLPLRADLLCTLQYETPCKYLRFVSHCAANRTERLLSLDNCNVLLCKCVGVLFPLKFAKPSALQCRRKVRKSGGPKEIECLFHEKVLLFPFGATVKLGDKERLDSEQLGNSEPFLVTTLLMFTDTRQIN